MKHDSEILLLFLFLLFLAVLAARMHEAGKPYKVFQWIYLKRELKELNAKRSRTDSVRAQEAINREMRILKRSLPRLQETVLEDGRRERCLSCHIGIEPISESHPEKVFGCVVCHGGDPLSVTLPTAHTGLIGGRNPSDFSVVDQSCGRTLPDGTSCHNGSLSDQRDAIHRVRTSIMSTKAGEIAMTRYTFGAQRDLNAVYAVSGVEGRQAVGNRKALPVFRPIPYTKVSDLPERPEERSRAKEVSFSGHPVDTRLRQNCVNRCHLGVAGGNHPYFARASGCASCHYLYDDLSYYRGKDPTISRTEPGHGAFHRLTLKIPHTQCNHCHNRGIHSFRKMRFIPRRDLSRIGGLPPGERRVRSYYNPMTLFTRCEVELDCIDCHTGEEIMGDGFLYGSERDQERIRCRTCHGTLNDPPRIRPLTSRESPGVKRIMRRYSRKAGEKALFTLEGELFPQVRIDEGRLFLTGKVSGKRMEIPQVFRSRCGQDPKRQDANSCHACHAMDSASHPLPRSR